MVNTTSGLKNVNLMTKEQFDGISDLASNELYAVSGSGIGFPSSDYEDLTLGASDSTYIAPANGWVFICKQTASTNQYITLANRTKNFSITNIPYASSVNIDMILPVQKNDVFLVGYNASGTLRAFRFIYAEGE